MSEIDVPDRDLGAGGEGARHGQRRLAGVGVVRPAGSSSGMVCPSVVSSQSEPAVMLDASRSESKVIVHHALRVERARGRRRHADAQDVRTAALVRSGGTESPVTSQPPSLWPRTTVSSVSCPGTCPSDRR